MDRLALEGSVYFPSYIRKDQYIFMEKEGSAYLHGEGWIDVSPWERMDQHIFMEEEGSAHFREDGSV